MGNAPRRVLQSGGAEGGSFLCIRGGHVLIHGDEVPQEHHAIASRGGGGKHGNVNGNGMGRCSCGKYRLSSILSPFGGLQSPARWQVPVGVKCESTEREK